MAKYDIRLTENGIELGMLNKNGQWHSGEEATEKVMSIVRDHLIKLSVKEGHDIAYAWQYNNGKTLMLKLEEKDTTEIKEEEEK